MSKWTKECEIAEKEMRELIPEHLDADLLIANAWNNTADVEHSIEVFISTVEMYIDQNVEQF